MPRLFVSPLRRVTREGTRNDQDLVAVEAPLTIEVTAHGAAPQSLGIFLRTPGDDESLGLGLLYAEGVIRSMADVAATTLTVNDDEASATLRVALAAHVAFDAAALGRSGIASTSCGLCGRLTEQLGNRLPAIENEIGTRFQETSPDLVFSLPGRLREAQTLFEETGGLHAAGFFDHTGAPADIAEDVGRHNAVDKIVGRALARGHLPARDRILVVSGRVAFEIVQKAAMAGVPTIVAVGAPTSLAVQAARDAGIRLIGFARDERFNIYS
ncbi:MAG: formate dehydrogenase accessory sulfurtransferase FdhD [Acidobacteria bacterium]|nr:MAG: formate dehydrogenase accessory sulfurtransferase FdhD [Acidobacteriota bacterium]